MAASQELTAQVHTIIRTTIGQYYVNQAVAHGVPRTKGQPGSGTHMATTRPELKSPPGWAGLANPVDYRAAGQSTPELDLRRLPMSSAAQS